MSETVVSIRKEGHEFVAQLGNRLQGSGLCTVAMEGEIVCQDLDFSLVLLEASVVARNSHVPLVIEQDANTSLATAMEEGYRLTQP